MSEIALKNDQDKVMLALIPPIALLEVGKVMTHGAKKYGAFNYMKGHKATQLISAALRHLIGADDNPGFMMGVDIDKDSGLPHLALAIAELMMLIQQQAMNTLNDDRPKIEANNG